MVKIYAHGKVLICYEQFFVFVRCELGYYLIISKLDVLHFLKIPISFSFKIIF